MVAQENYIEEHAIVAKWSSGECSALASLSKCQEQEYSVTWHKLGYLIADVSLLFLAYTPR